ncbi:MAG: metallophosphoesterase, partial [Bacillota bacterium]|nr:metallophosphoesterase [Bacillota bacterium]
HLILPFLLLIPGGVYLYFYLLRVADFWGLKSRNKKVKTLAVVLAIAAVISSVNLFGFPALVVLHMIGITLCLEILNLVFASFHKHKGMKIGLWNKVFRCGLAPVIITSLILVCGYFNMENVVETDYTIHTGKAIREQGYRIAMIADLHFGTTMNEEKLKKYCNEIEGKKPDLVVLCGDIVDQNTTLLQMKNAVGILGNIKSSFGTFYVYGNHDKSSYGFSRNFSAEQLRNELDGNGINVLEDEVYYMNDEVAIIGRKDRGFSSGIKRKTTEELLSNLDKNRFLLLIDHQPSELQENSGAGIDLQLSGHTHAGQIWPEGLFNELTGIGQLNYGYEKINDYQIIVTSGIGGWGYPIRTGSHSEFVIVDVKS